MSNDKFEIRPEELEAFLDEALPATRMREIEELLREDRQLAEQLEALLKRRDLGVLSVAEVWRRHRLSCPLRDDLGAYLLQALPAEEMQFIRNHQERVGCRYCQANLEDLQQRYRVTMEQAQAVQRRRRRFFQSSLPHLGHSGDS